MENETNLYGLIDKQDQSRGLNLVESKKRITVRDNLVFCDTRDCVGTQSLLDTQGIFKIRGGRSELSDNVLTTTGDGVSPIVITSVNTIVTNELKNGDRVSITGVQGNKAANGLWVVQNFTVALNSTFELQGSVGNGNYAGGGTIIRKADPGWPIIKDTTSTVIENVMTIKLPKKLKVVRSLSLIHTVIPRDIIPLSVYLPDFLEFSEFIDADVPRCPEVRVATTVAGTLATDFEKGDTIDGIVLVENDRILIKNQAAAVENGIWIVQNAGTPIRSSDLPATTPAVSVLNYYVIVKSGTINTGTSWVCTVATGAVGVGNLTFTSFTGMPISWVSYIPQEKKEVEKRSIGFYSTPLEIFRTYIDGSFAMPNQYTPPPLKLWNPPVGGVTHQLQPYTNQTVPTYTSDVFNVTSRTGDFYVILAGYGIYDLNDWTYRLDPSDLVNEILTRIGRILLLLALVPNQSYKGEDDLSLIINSNTTGGLSSTAHFGYGDYQRFVPGPGLGMHYQPGTSDGADPTVSTTESPVPFPNFRGNVWGPYNSPGDRFQKVGLRDTLQDLFLNGDTSNMFGTSIIKPWVSVECIPSDSTFGIYFPAFIALTFGNIKQATNLNIINAMRIVPNGYGALNVINLGNSATITNKFLNSGGQGPDVLGTPQNGYASTPGGGGAWVDNEVLDASGTGIGEFGDEIATGPNYVPSQTAGSETMNVEFSDASYIGTETTQAGAINRRDAYYDLGPNSSNFISEMVDYRDWAITELPDTNIIISIFQAERDQRVQFTNQEHTSCILSCPVRLNLGTTSGTQEYVENIQSLLSNSSEFWEKRYLAPLQSLYKLNIKFTTFEGVPILLEKMLQPRRSVLLLQAFERIFGTTTSNLFSSSRNRESTLSFLFDPLDPRLVGREKRNISLTFRAQTYEYESPGLYMGVVKEMLDSDSEQQENHHPFIVRAANYQNYN